MNVRSIDARLPMLGATLVLALGCAAPPRPDPDYGREVFDALRQATAAAAASVGPHLALVKRQSEMTNTVSRMVGNQPVETERSKAREPMNGILLTAEGHILVQEILKPDLDDRIEVWVGEDEYSALPLKVDEQLGMSILKIESDTAFHPISWSNAADLAVGEWAVVVVPGDEECDFERSINLGMCRGVRAGRYRMYTFDHLAGVKGAPAVNLRGDVVGIRHCCGVLSLADLREPLERFLAEATGVRSPEESQRQTAWLGVGTMPISKPYARLKGLPVGGQWVTHVAKDSPAERAGLQPGDLIVQVNGADLRFSGRRAYHDYLQSLGLRIDAPFALTLLRDGKEVHCDGVFAKQPEPDKLRVEDIGVSLQDVYEHEAFALNLFTDAGVLVTEVHKGSPAATGQTFQFGLLNEQDLIVEFAGQPTPDVQTFAEVLDRVRRDKPGAVLVKYVRGRATGYAGLNLRIGERDNGGTR